MFARFESVAGDGTAPFDARRFVVEDPPSVDEYEPPLLVEKVLSQCSGAWKLCGTYV